MREATYKIPAATVLYKPDTAILARMLAALDPEARRVYIVINGPIEQQVEDCLKVLALPVIIRFPENIGLGAALNAILKRVADDGAEFVLLLDQDSILAPGTIGELAKRFSAGTADEPVAVAGPLLVAPPNSGYLNIRYEWRDETLGTAYFVPTSGSLISINAWKTIGQFREDYFIGGIDVEWGFRAWSHGYSSIVVKATVMEHRWGTEKDGSSGAGWQIARHSNARVYFYIRNTIDCFKQHYIPTTWKAKKAFTLTAQVSVFVIARRFSYSSLKTIAHAIYDGVFKKMGPRNFADL